MRRSVPVTTGITRFFYEDYLKKVLAKAFQLKKEDYERCDLYTYDTCQSVQGALTGPPWKQNTQGLVLKEEI